MRAGTSSQNRTSMKRSADEADPDRAVKQMVAKLEEQWTDGGEQQRADPMAGPRIERGRGCGEPSFDTSGGVGKREVHVTCPTNSAGKLIGKGGQTIKALRDHSGARIILHDVEPGRDTRIISISGSEQQVNIAVAAVQEVFEEAGVVHGVQVVEPGKLGASGGFGRPPPPSLQTEVHLSCPVAAAGQLIGKKGETIRMIRERSGAKVVLHDIENGIETRTIGVSGSESAVQTAVAMIKETFMAAMSGGVAEFGPNCGPTGDYGGGGAQSLSSEPSEAGMGSSVDDKLARWVLAKRTKDFQTADRLREELRVLGIDAELARPPWPTHHQSTNSNNSAGLTASFSGHQPSPQTGPKQEFLLSCPTASAGKLLLR